MTSQPTTPAAAGKRSYAIAFTLACFLIAEFLWRTFTTAHEYPMRSAQILSISLDLLAVIGLIGTRRYIPTPMFWIALVAGLALFAIRFTSDAAWWTGHLTYSLSPR